MEGKTVMPTTRTLQYWLALAVLALGITMPTVTQAIDLDRSAPPRTSATGRHTEREAAENPIRGGNCLTVGCTLRRNWKRAQDRVREQNKPQPQPAPGQGVPRV